jgi:hypothetical protein
MLTTSRASVCFLLLLGLGACSSKSTDDGNTAGNGGIVPGGGTASGGGGASSGGSPTLPNGGGRSDGGTTASGGATSPAAQECLDKPVICKDDDTAFSCNPDTLMDESFTCSTGVADLGPGLISEGCLTSAEGSGCSFDFADTECRDGAPAFAACYRAATGNDIDDLQAYFACFTDSNGLHAIMPCFADFVDAAAATVDCSAAEEACFPDEGAGGAGGAGG